MNAQQREQRLREIMSEDHSTFVQVYNLLTPSDKAAVKEGLKERILELDRPAGQ